MPTLIMTGENEIGSTPRMSQDIHNEIQNSQLHIIKNQQGDSLKGFIISSESEEGNGSQAKKLTFL